MKTILVVDDEPDVLAVVSSRLEKSGYRVIGAAGGADGVQSAQQHKPDLILMDVLMPGLSGGDAVKKIRSIKELANVPVIFLSAVATSDSSADWTINAGGDRFLALSKPLDVDRLLIEIRHRIG